MKRKIYAWDFDNTITVEKGDRLFRFGQVPSEDKIRKNLRNPEAVRKYMAARKESGDINVIVTFASMIEPIVKHLEVLLGKDWKQFISHIEYGYKLDKNAHIRADRV